jgi:hypothetical protein
MARLDASALAAITEADTLFVASSGSGKGVDVSHRSGKRGFVMSERPSVQYDVPAANGSGVARKVTLLLRHWGMANEPSGGASVALRLLVDAARTAYAASDRQRLARQAADHLMAVMAGNEPGYEEASRAICCGSCALRGRDSSVASRHPGTRQKARPSQLGAAGHRRMTRRRGR